jgi:hypothetical protein
MEAESRLSEPGVTGQQAGSLTEELPVVPSDLAGMPVGRHRQRRRARWVIAVTLVLIAAGVSFAIADPVSSHRPGQRGVIDNAYPTSVATVTRRSLASQTQVNATLGYAGSYSVIGQASGTVTWLPGVGQVVSQGQVLYRVDGNPVVLLYGSTPAWRTLSAGLSGVDVAELNADLVALGYATSSQLSPSSDYFGSATTTALEKLQAVLGVTENGTLTLGEAVFLPTAVRVTTISAAFGGAAQAGQTVLQATSTARQVTIALDVNLQSDLKVGDQVSITLPDGSTTPGVVSSVGTVATTSSSSSSGGSASTGSGSGSSGNGSGSGGGSGSSPTVTVEVTPTEPAATGSLDQAPVEVSITTTTVSDALVVPVDALLALSSGGYAVEVVNSDGTHRLVDVTAGVFDTADSLVQVTGSDLAAGQHVVVPAT